MKLSVCMAVYNGEKYIEKQVMSILDQVGKLDELIIVDDDSTDNSNFIIHNFKDPRIKLIKNNNNLGVIKSFEISLNNASGDIIFFSDQDDIWLPNKVNKVVHAFEANATITMVVSDAQIIDHNGDIIKPSLFQVRGKFTDKTIPNLIKNKYYGCTMSFRRGMLKFFLPFPHDIPMHDLWIGIINSIYGNTVYIEEPLIQYRRHNNNTTLGILKHSGIFQMLKWRISVVKNLIYLLVKHRYKIRNIRNK